MSRNWVRFGTLGNGCLTDVTLNGQQQQSVARKDR
jgi:hypothetical protein